MRKMTLKKLVELEQTEMTAEQFSEFDKKQRFLFRKKINEIYDFIMSKITLMRQLCCHSLLYNYNSHSVTYNRFIEDYEKFIKKRNLRPFAHDP